MLYGWVVVVATTTNKPRLPPIAPPPSVKASRLAEQSTIGKPTSNSLRAQPSSQSGSTNAVLLSTPHGNIVVQFRPDLGSPGSVEYVAALGNSSDCDRCTFYRKGKDFLLQGLMRSRNFNVTSRKGACPDNCLGECDADSCHGPIMSHGMVAWAAGRTGPDFFINLANRPVEHWGHEHTVWGEVKDEESFAVIETIINHPLTLKGNLKDYEHKVNFTMRTLELCE